MKKKLVVLVAAVFCLFLMTAKRVSASSFAVDLIISSIVVGVDGGQPIRPEMSEKFRQRLDFLAPVLPKINYNYRIGQANFGFNISNLAFGLSCSFLTKNLVFLAGIENLPATKPPGYYDDDRLKVSSRFGVVFNF